MQSSIGHRAVSALQGAAWAMGALVFLSVIAAIILWVFGFIQTLIMQPIPYDELMLAVMAAFFVGATLPFKTFAFLLATGSILYFALGVIFPEKLVAASILALILLVYWRLLWVFWLLVRGIGTLRDPHRPEVINAFGGFLAMVTSLVLAELDPFKTAWSNFAIFSLSVMAGAAFIGWFTEWNKPKKKA